VTVQLRHIIRRTCIKVGWVRRRWRQEVGRTQPRKLFRRKLFAALKVAAETIFRFKQGILTTFHAYDKSREVNPMYHVNPPDIENRVKYAITTRRTRKRL
jgi:hypothetical protein